MSEASSILGVMGNIASTAINNYGANYRTEQDRKENYKYGEMAAENADRRTRALYADFYSPEALKRQYEAAGLSPSMMFGGTPGQGGMSGAQGSGAAGPQTPFMPVSLLEGAQIANIMADTAKKKEEAKNISTDTEIKNIEKGIKDLEAGQFKDQMNILTTHLVKHDGTETSLYEIANESKTFEDFLQTSRNWGLEANSETEMQTLRNIYWAANKFETDINVLSTENVNAKFQQSIIDALNAKDFPKENAAAAIAQIKAAAATSELTEQQKNAWNNLIAKLDKLGSDWKDIIVVLGMILGRYAQSSNIKINTGDTFVTRKD